MKILKGDKIAPFVQPTGININVLTICSIKGIIQNSWNIFWAKYFAAASSDWSYLPNVVLSLYSQQTKSTKSMLDVCYIDLSLWSVQVNLCILLFKTCFVFTLMCYFLESPFSKTASSWWLNICPCFSFLQKHIFTINIKNIWNLYYFV